MIRFDPAVFNRDNIARLADDDLRALISLLLRAVRDEAVIPTSPELRALLADAYDEQARRAWDAVDRHAAEAVALLNPAA